MALDLNWPWLAAIGLMALGVAGTLLGGATWFGLILGMLAKLALVFTMIALFAPSYLLSA